MDELISGEEYEDVEVLEEVEVERRLVWNEGATRHLLSLVTATQDRVGTSAIKTKTKMWKHIAFEMRHFGQEFTAAQVENKFRSLERAYKKMVLNNKSTGRARMSIPFQSELEDLLGKKKGVNPTYLLATQPCQLDDSSDTTTAENESGSCSTDIQQKKFRSSASDTETPRKKVRSSASDRCVEMMEEIQKSQEKQQANFLNFLKTKEENKAARAARKEELLNKILEKL